MDSITEIMQLCRLCLVKEEVNIPIFGEHGDIRHIFLKISACLPVKISKEDNLPKKICDGCSCKLEMLYRFWNTSVNSEKKLIQWLEQIGAEETSDKGDIANTNSLNTQHSISSNPVVLKQEVVELTDTQSAGEDLIPDLKVPSDEQDYLMQSQQLPYQSVEFQFQQDGFDTVIAEEESSNIETETQPKQRKRRAAAMKALASMESEGEDDPDLINTKIAKTEEESDDSAGEDPEPTTFVGIPSADDEQPGPSGIGKPSNDAPVLDLCFIYGHQCKICWKTFPLKSRLRLHMSTHSDEKPFSCDICSKRFKGKYDVNVHKKRCHGNCPIYECDVCGSKLKSKGAFQLHKNRHSKLFATHCPICEKGFYTKGEELRHIAIDHEKSFYECKICGKPLRQRATLLSHMETHKEDYYSNKKFKCTKCPKAFNYKNCLKIHLNTHNEEGSGHLCYICGKSYVYKQHLNEHLLKHNEQKPFKCDQCNNRFSSRYNLRIHERSHTGVKPYACNVCEKRFTQRPPFVVHMRTHTGEKPYKCDLCDKNFVTKGVMETHKKSKHRVLSAKVNK